MAKEKQLEKSLQVIINGIMDSNPIWAKIDTGADYSSLHATNVSFDDNRLRFIIDDCQYETANFDIIDVKTADGGTERRPVLTLFVNVPEFDAEYSDVRFTLNDRSNMDSKILLGGTFLKCDDFVIKYNDDDTEIEEDEEEKTDTSNVTIAPEETEPSKKDSDKKHDKDRVIHEIIALIKHHDISMMDLINFKN